VEEAYAAGIREMIFVTGRHKRAIDDHFDMAYELERELEDAGKQALLDLVRSVKPDDMVCIAVRQARALGLGHAVLCAEPLVAGEAFAVLLADDLMVGEPPVMAQMTARFAELGSSIVAVQEVPHEHTRRYGIVAGEFLSDDLMDVRQFVEKPAPEVAPSNWGVAGRYVLTPEVFDQIRNQPRGVGGEIQLTDGIAGLMATQKVHAFRYAGKRYDCGSKEGFLEATVDLAMAREDLAPSLRQVMQRWV
jgi:UTP--glucose-1-phosphate uridylyltransferase